MPSVQQSKAVHGTKRYEIWRNGTFNNKQNVRKKYAHVLNSSAILTLWKSLNDARSWFFEYEILKENKNSVLQRSKSRSQNFCDLLNTKMLLLVYLL